MLVAALLGHWLRRKLLVLDVSGHSMEPALRVGDRLLCARGARPTRGAIVVWSQSQAAPGQPYLIKRVVALPGDRRGGAVIPDGSVWLEGDAAGQSFDSRRVGAIPVARVYAVAVARLSRGQLTDLRLTRAPARSSY